MRVLALGACGLAAALLAWASGEYRLRGDWTSNGDHSLSESSRLLLERLDGQPRITAYASTAPVVRGAVRSLVDRYQRVEPGLALEFVDPASRPEIVQRKNIRVDGEMVIELDGRAEHARELNERSVTNALARLAKGGERWIAALGGHGERSFDDDASYDYGALRRELGRVGLEVRTLDLSDAVDVPDNAALLVLSEPRAPWRPEEVVRVKRYLDRGGNLLWLADPAVPPALPWLGRRLGVSFGPGAIVDPEAANPAIVVAGDYSSHPAVAHLRVNTVFALATPIGWERPEGFQTTGLVSAGMRAFAETGALDGRVAFDQDADTPGPLDIGIAMARVVDGTGSGSARQQRIAVFGDGDFLSNAFLGQGGNLALALNLFGWLAGSEALIDVPARDVVDARFEPGAAARWLIALGPPVAVPLALVAIGAFVWRRRQRL